MNCAVPTAVPSAVVQPCARSIRSSTRVDYLLMTLRRGLSKEVVRNLPPSEFDKGRGDSAGALDDTLQKWRWRL